MSREIKFRGRRVDNGEWVIGYYYHSTINGKHFIADMVETVAHEVDPDTVGEFTGLTTKAGVELFEGDIVKYRRMLRNKEVWFTSAIVWNNGFVLSPNKTVMHDHFAIGASLSSIEVIGNVYENEDNGITLK